MRHKGFRHIIVGLKIEEDTWEGVGVALRCWARTQDDSQQRKDLPYHCKEQKSNNLNELRCRFLFRTSRQGICWLTPFFQPCDTLSRESSHAGNRVNKRVLFEATESEIICYVTTVNEYTGLYVSLTQDSELRHLRLCGWQSTKLSGAMWDQVVSQIHQYTCEVVMVS